MNASKFEQRGLASNKFLKESTSMAIRKGHRKRVNQNTLLVTLDIGKNTNYAYLRTGPEKT